MKSRLLAAVAIGAVFLVAPASAQVKIGILNDQSRVYADSGGKYSLEAARMAVEDFGGEVLGQKIEIVTADHQNKPDLATAIARRWYDTEGVDMITELTTSSVALAVQELSKEKKKIDIVVGAATSRITGDACTPYSFHWAYDTREGWPSRRPTSRFHAARPRLDGSTAGLARAMQLASNKRIASYTRQFRRQEEIQTLSQALRIAGMPE